MVKYCVEGWRTPLPKRRWNRCFRGSKHKGLSRCACNCVSVHRTGGLLWVKAVHVAWIVLARGWSCLFELLFWKSQLAQITWGAVFLVTALLRFHVCFSSWTLNHPLILKEIPSICTSVRLVEDQPRSRRFLHLNCLLNMQKKKKSKSIFASELCLSMQKGFANV